MGKRNLTKAEQLAAENMTEADLDAMIAEQMPTLPPSHTKRHRADEEDRPSPRSEPVAVLRGRGMRA